MVERAKKQFTDQLYRQLQRPSSKTELGTITDDYKYLETITFIFINEAELLKINHIERNIIKTGECVVKYKD